MQQENIYSKEELKKIVINCIGISLVPSIPIVLSVIVMVPVLGVALPWLRTSVIGSANNELISATMAAEAMGVEFTSTTMTIEAWINAAWSMTLGCSVALPIVLVVLKPVCKTYDVFRKKDSRWIGIFSLCALVTVIAAFAINSGSAISEDMDEMYGPYQAFLRSVHNVENSLKKGVTTIREVGSPKDLSIETAFAVEKGWIKGSRVSVLIEALSAENVEEIHIKDMSQNICQVCNLSLTSVAFTKNIIYVVTAPVLLEVGDGCLEAPSIFILFVCLNY